MTMIDPYKIYREASALYSSAFRSGRRLNLEEELVVSRSIVSSYNYAYNILKGRFELGEETISTSYCYSYHYALEILRGRFQLGEKSIVKDLFYCILYISDVLHGTIPLDFLELCSIEVLDRLVSVHYSRNITNRDDVIRVLFKKRLL